MRRTRIFRVPRSLLALGAPLVLLAGCEPEGPPVETETVPEEARPVEAPDLFVPTALDDEDRPIYDEGGLRFRDYSHVMHAIAEVGALSRDSELGHEAFRPELGGERMRQRGELWLEMIDRLQATFDDEGAWAPYLVETPEGWHAVGAPDLADYAQGVYTYQTHHRSGRWGDLGLETEMIHRPAAFTTSPGIHLLGTHYADGRFYHDPEHTAFDEESMANGVAGLHAHIYAWVRWEKAGGADDHGQIEEGRLVGWLQYGPDDLVQVARALAVTFDEAWRDDLGAYVFDDEGADGVTYRTESVGALLRGQKALVDLLYMFGADDDRDHVDRLFARSTVMLRPLLDLARPWGLPERVTFTAEGVEPAASVADVAGTWSFVHHLTGGYAYTRERDETSQLLTEEAPALLDAVGAFTDTLLEGALEYGFRDGAVVTSLDYETGEVVDGRRSAEAIGLFLMGAGNAYGAGEAFASPGDWDDDAVAERTRALYTALADQADLLEAHFLRSAID